MVEGEGVVFVRLVMVGRTARPIQVQLSTVDGSAMSKNVNSLIPSPHVTYCKWGPENETKAWFFFITSCSHEKIPGSLHVYIFTFRSGVA